MLNFWTKHLITDLWFDIAWSISVYITYFIYKDFIPDSAMGYQISYDTTAVLVVVSRERKFP